MPVKIGLDAPMTELFKTCPNGVLVIDRNQKICDANPAFSHLFGLGEKKLIGTPIDTLPGEAVPNDLYAEPLIRIQLPDQTVRWLQCTTQAIEHLPSTVAEMRFYHDVTQMVQLQTENRNLAEQLESSQGNDPLTGLLNPAAVRQALAAEVSRSRRYQNPLSVMLIRISANATDNLIHALGGLLRDQLRWADIVARSDHCDFTVVLPETSLVSARALATKLAPMIEAETDIETSGSAKVEMAYIGVAQWQTGDDSNMLVARAAETMERQFGVPTTLATG